MLKIGMIGESEYDRDALKNLLNKYYGNVQFISLLKKVRGTQLDQAKTLDILEIELTDKNLDAILVQRDLDAAEGDARNTRLRNEFFSGVQQKTSAKGFFLLHIHTIEALIIADLDSFNRKFKVAASFTGNPMFQEKPKSWLREKCKRDKYEAKHSPEIFAELDLQKLKGRVKYFNAFITEFEQYIQKAA